MLLGFISLLLTVTQDKIAEMCIPKRVGNSWHPCDRDSDKDYEDKCTAKDKGQVQFVSAYGLHQLHIFIFVLAVSHVLYCILTLGLGTLKILRGLGTQGIHRSGVGIWIFGVALRFYSGYPIIWLFAVLFLLTNTHGWYSYLWLPFIPLIILLVVGAKLQVIITQMGLRIQDRGDVVKGTPVVQPGDDLFWFNHPRLILFLIHIVLFTYKFGFRSCFHRRLEDIIIRLSMGVVIQVLCSYVTLPLYALVTQMGSTMKPTIFNDQVVSALRNWHHSAKKQAKNGRQSETATSTPFSSRPGTPLHGLSPLHLLNGYRNSTAVDPRSQASPRKSDAEMIELWDPESAWPRSPSRHHDYREDSRMSRWNDQVGDEIGELGATQMADSESRAAVDGGRREVSISLRDFSFNQSDDRRRGK
ncbi:hypothetical protein Vadar_029674 [Vaccinium darrowii]|uniref:Uncharacterized protein n=1 Tax=Vaccinium darrowii TaxID=229202 RepID=A0ACB7XL04_9ERIC|nr:hypothetical protein Vadar_029674 [Vaccinium darrowii]